MADIQPVLQIAGALVILAAFAAGQFNLLAPDSRVYLGANAIGSAVLTATAVAAAEWGFVLLEGCWAVASLYGLVRRARTPAPGLPH